MITLVAKKELKQLSFTERKLAGLQKRKPDQVDYILSIEKLWEAYAWNRTDENMQRLLNSFKFMLHRKAEAGERKWKNKRLHKDDFLSVFYETAGKLCDDYCHYQAFYFYETLCLAIDRRGIDLTRKLTTKQGRFEVAALPLFDETADYLPDISVDIENDVVTNDLVGRILKDESLTDKERRLLQIIYDNPKTSNPAISVLSDLKSHQQVDRYLNRIQNKLSFNYS